MARDPRRRQKAQARRNRRHEARKQQQSRRGAGGLGSADAAHIIRYARDLPVHECLIGESWKDEGKAQILLARKQPDGLIAFGVYLVDTGCLGLKSAFCNANFSSARYEREVRGRLGSQDTLVPCPLALAHEIIYGGIGYARGLGFSPDKDFSLSRYLLEPRERFAGQETGVEFGRDGMPFFVPGPHDDVQKIMSTLERTVGKGNFTYIVPVCRPGWEVEPAERQ
ncbi:hypothetical protein HQ576_09925 [bacterium]|nr:hypothetical protein [bacterium]